jgi:hypothetical protein
MNKTINDQTNQILNQSVEDNMEINDMSELEVALSSQNDLVRSSVSTQSNKMKKAVAIRETQRMKLVQQHPMFLENPLNAMKLHIEHLVSFKKK